MKNTVRHFQPHPLLAQYVDLYTLRKINLEKGEFIDKLMPHRKKTSIDFFLGTNYTKIDLATQKEKKCFESTLRGFRTFSKYRIIIEKEFKSLTIEFKPSGLFGLFGIPMQNFTNNDIALSEIDILPVNEIETRLNETSSENSYKSILDEYLLKVYRKKTWKMRLQTISRSKLVTHDVNLLANQIGVSLRQTERIFLNELGLNHSKWKMLNKFDAAIKFKIAQPSINWTELAFQFNYYDQPEFIRTFKKHLSISPTQFKPSQFAF